MSVLTIPKLVGHIQAALAADAHAFKTGVPSLDDAMRAVRKADGLTAVNRGVELGSVDKVSGVMHRVPLVRLGQRAGTDLRVDVAEREGLGLLVEQSTDLRAEHRRGVVEADRRVVGDGVKRLGAGAAG